MRVQVDDARHQREPAGIDDLGRVLADLADRGDAAILDRNVGADRVVPKPVHQGGPADQEVMHRPSPASKNLLSKTFDLYCSYSTWGLSCWLPCVNRLHKT